MGGAVVGRVDGRANALTLVLPLNRLGRWYLPILFRWIDRDPRRPSFDRVDRLRFIYAIRWSLLPPFTPGAAGHGPDRRWHLLFESNFDGDWDEYLDAFGSVLGPGLDRIVCTCVDYPGLDTISLFKAWAKAHDHIPEHYACAYPDLTVTDIRQGLAATGNHDVPGLLRERGFGRRAPSWATFVVPLAAGRNDAAIAAARRLGRTATPADPVSSGVLDGPGTIHFGRVVVLEQPAGEWLLLTLVHDHPRVRDLVVGLLAADGRRGERGEGAPLHDLLGCADGAHPGIGDASLADYLLACQPRSVRHTLRYAAYPGWSAGQIAALEPRRGGPPHSTWPLPEDVS